MYFVSYLTNPTQVFALATWVIIFSNDPASLGWFKFHPLLQTLAIGCFTYGKHLARIICVSPTTFCRKGILTLQPTSQPHTKAAGLQRHQIAIIGLGVPLILAGGLAIILQKNSHDAPHFTTWHGVSDHRFSPVCCAFMICVDIWTCHRRVDRRPNTGRGLDCVAWRRCLGWWNEGQGDVEVSQVTNDARGIILVTLTRSRGS